MTVRTGKPRLRRRAAPLSERTRSELLRWLTDEAAAGNTDAAAALLTVSLRFALEQGLAAFRQRAANEGAECRTAS